MHDSPFDAPLPAWRWTESRNGTAVLFVGRDAGDSPEELLRWLSPGPQAVSWLRQMHSNRVREAESGLVGEGDALISGETALGLTVATADCVPVLLSADASIAAVHAGWRGLEAHVLAEAIAALQDGAPPLAWVGPTIGPCCYEIGDDVAGRLAAVGPSTAFTVGPRGRTHADLQAIARYQLETAGASVVRSIDLCTRCESGLLESYRRDGPKAGRNWAMIWRS